MIKWTPDSVGVELEPVDSCAINNGGCAHSCRHEDGGAVCSCRKGYILQIDRKSCLGESTGTVDETAVAEIDYKRLGLL